MRATHGAMRIRSRHGQLLRNPAGARHARPAVPCGSGRGMGSPYGTLQERAMRATHGYE